MIHFEVRPPVGDLLRRATGSKARERARLAMGCDPVDRGQDRLLGRDAAQLGAPGRTRSGVRAGPTSDERERIKALEREVRELRQAKEILRKASAYFAQAVLDRRLRS